MPARLKRTCVPLCVPLSRCVVPGLASLSLTIKSVMGEYYPVSSPYQPTDSLHLWYFSDPVRPRLVDTLRLMLTGLGGVSLRYAPSWLSSGFALSEDLLLLDMEQLPRELHAAAGAVDDARLDCWGERVIRFVERPSRLSLLEMLYFASDARFGALGASTSSEAYLPSPSGPLPLLGDPNRVHELIRSVLADEPVSEAERCLIARGASMGRARPKALLDIDNAQWVLKFSDEPDFDEPLVEHAAVTLAAHAGIAVAETQPVHLSRGSAMAIKRFDRPASGARIHALSCLYGTGCSGRGDVLPGVVQIAAPPRPDRRQPQSRTDARAVSPAGLQHPDRQHRRS